MYGDYLTYILFSFLFTIPISYVLVSIFKRIIEKKINSEQDFKTIEMAEEFIEQSTPLPNIEIVKSTSNPTIKTDVRFILPYLISGLITVFLIIYLTEGTTRTFKFIFFSLFSAIPLVFLSRLVYLHSAKIRKKIVWFSILIYALLLIIFSWENLYEIPSKIFGVVILFGMVTIIFRSLYFFTTIKQISFAVFPAAFITVFFFFSFVNTMAKDEEQLAFLFNPLYDVLSQFSLENSTSLIFMMILYTGVLLLGFIASLIIRFAFIRKWYNNMMFIADTLWLSQITYLVISFHKHSGQLLYIPVLFILYKMINMACIRLIKPKYAENKRLLLLRVFSLGKQSEQVFHKIQNWWTQRGSIQLIAGYDLTASIVDIDDILTFYAGKMHLRFNVNRYQIQQNMNKLDFKPDLDGRYRVNEMYCNNSTWKTVLHHLIQKTDYTLMDIRTFSKVNAGCAHEIKSLIHYIPLNKILFLINEKTDMAFFKATAEEAWKRMPVDSPNINSTENIKVFAYLKESDFDSLTSLYNL